MKRKLTGVYTVFLCVLLLVFSGVFPVSAEQESDIPAPCTSQVQGAVREIEFNGNLWSRVTAMNGSQEYLITAVKPDDSSDTGFTYEVLGSSFGESWVVSSGANGISLKPVSESKYSLVCSDNTLLLYKRPASSSSETAEPVVIISGFWSYSGRKLSFTSEDTVFYLTCDENGFGCSSDIEAAADIVLFTSGPEYNPCITGTPQIFDYVTGEDYEAPLPKIQFDDSLEELSVQWMIDGVPYESAEDVQNALKEVPYGVYGVTCEVSGWKDDVRYGEISPESCFIAASGVLENSFLTFSDVHMEFDSIGDAIHDVMLSHDGKIPSLVICTGDWANGSTSSYDITKNDLLPVIKAELAGLDTVYVAGNHENGLAAAEESIAADLGADDSFLRGYGEIFRSETAKENGTSSREAHSLSVYGVNFDALGGDPTYESITEDVKQYLKTTAENDPHTLVVISTHTGLHKLEDWGGGNKYNITGSDKLCEAINEAADQYGLDVIFLFGHDHSRNEIEFLYERGEILEVTKIPEEETVPEELNFTYGHAGYLTSSIGSGDRHYSFFTWDDQTITRYFEQVGLGPETVTKISRLPVPESPAETPAAVIPNPSSGFSRYLLPGVFALCGVLLFAVIVKRARS